LLRSHEGVSAFGDSENGPKRAIVRVLQGEPLMRGSLVAEAQVFCYDG